jgi:hypothetical protein
LVITSAKTKKSRFYFNCRCGDAECVMKDDKSFAIQIHTYPSLIIRYSLPLTFSKSWAERVYLCAGILNNLQENGQPAVQQKAPSAVINKKSTMAYPNLTLIGALRQAAANLEGGATYAWGNHGACNCGHLLQVVTHLSRAEILRYAHTGIGEWTEIAEGYCEVSKAPAYMLIAKLEAIGLTPTDIHCLEYLSDRTVLDQLPGGYRPLRKNVREDVILYFRTLAQLLEDKLLQTINIPQPAALTRKALA